MGKLTFNDIEERGLLLYKYIRGSHCYGLNIETSDIDEGGVYMAPAEQLLGLGLDYQDEIEDERNDKSWFELNKFMNLLIKSNPTVLEALFVDDEFVTYESPIMKILKENRDMFLTQECFKPLIGYSISQIEKARGLNKKIVNPIKERKHVLDFCYTFYSQGSTKIKNWLEYRGLKQEYCGLVNIPNMRDIYGVYYDIGKHIYKEFDSKEEFVKLYNSYDDELSFDKNLSPKHSFIWYLQQANAFMPNFNPSEYYDKVEIHSYKGMVSTVKESNELRLSSVIRGQAPICYMSYNKDGYTKHCNEYREQKEWEKIRNPERYESNLHKNYDSKNMMHSFRLVTMGIEIAEGKGFRVNRRNIDRDFLLDIRNHKFEYDELIDKLEERKNYFKGLIDKGVDLKEKVDVNIVNDLLLRIRKEQLNIYK